MTASMPRSLRALAALGVAAALAACAATPPPSPARVRAELLRQFQEGRVRLECASCRFDFRNAEWMLRDGHQDELVVSILESGDGSGRSWYLLGRAAEVSGAPHLALLYYTRSLGTRRSPIVPLWPLYDDVTYRIRELVRAPEPAAAEAPAPPPAATDAPKNREYVTRDSISVRTRPGQIGAYLVSLSRGDSVEVLERSGEWELVRLETGRMGWVWGRYTQPRQETVAATPEAPREIASAKAPAPPKAAPAKKPAAPKRAAAKPSAKPSAAAKQRAAAKPEAAPKATAAAKPAEKTAAPVAQANAATPAPSRIALTPAGGFGIHGSPIPEGARLAGQSYGVGGRDDHPTQTYEIPAAATDIVGFFEREMQRAGWRKSFVSSEFLLYFVKEDQTLGILVEREGGTFTLMGS